MSVWVYGLTDLDEILHIDRADDLESQKASALNLEKKHTRAKRRQVASK